jgi:hypothetical protein
VFFYYVNKYNIKYILKKNFFKRFYYFNLLTFNFYKKNLFTVLRCRNKLVNQVTSGIISKKLGVDDKKSKNTDKVFNITIKAAIKKYKEDSNFYKLIVQIKGIHIYNYRLVDFLKNIFINYVDYYIIYTPLISSSFIIIIILIN